MSAGATKSEVSKTGRRKIWHERSDAVFSGMRYLNHPVSAMLVELQNLFRFRLVGFRLRDDGGSEQVRQLVQSPSRDNTEQQVVVCVAVTFEIGAEIEA